MKPSDVILSWPVPLVDTLHRLERELAAGMIERTLQVNGDAWRSVTLTEVLAVFNADFDAGTEPWVSIPRNPLYVPDFVDLAKHGYAVGTQETGLALTDKALAAIAAKWARRVLS